MDGSYLHQIRKTKGSEQSYSIPAVEQVLLPFDKDRIGFMISSVRGANIYIGRNRGNITGVGFFITVNRDPVPFTEETVGDLVKGPIYGIAESGTSTFAIWQSMLCPCETK